MAKTEGEILRDKIASFTLFLQGDVTDFFKEEETLDAETMRILERTRKSCETLYYKIPRI